MRSAYFAIAASGRAIVVDVGTSSGVPLCLASTRRPAKIYAMDYLNFIEVATLRGAGKWDPEYRVPSGAQLQFMRCGKVDVILHEHSGSGLFNEKMIEMLVDLAGALGDGGKIIPARFDGMGFGGRELRMPLR